MDFCKKQRISDFGKRGSFVWYIEGTFYYWALHDGFVVCAPKSELILSETQLVPSRRFPCPRGKIQIGTVN